MNLIIALWSKLLRFITHLVRAAILNLLIDLIIIFQRLIEGTLHMSYAAGLLVIAGVAEIWDRIFHYLAGFCDYFLALSL